MNNDLTTKAKEYKKDGICYQYAEILLQNYSYLAEIEKYIKRINKKIKKNNEIKDLKKDADMQALMDYFEDEKYQEIFADYNAKFTENTTLKNLIDEAINNITTQLNMPIAKLQLRKKIIKDIFVSKKEIKEITTKYKMTYRKVVEEKEIGISQIALYLLPVNGVIFHTVEDLELALLAADI